MAMVLAGSTTPECQLDSECSLIVSAVDSAIVVVVVAVVAAVVVVAAAAAAVVVAQLEPELAPVGLS